MNRYQKFSCLIRCRLLRVLGRVWLPLFLGVAIEAAAQDLRITTPGDGTRAAPDSIITIHGLHLEMDASQGTEPSTGLLGDSAGVTVEFNGIAAALLFVGSDRVNAIVPRNTPLGKAQVRVRANGGKVDWSGELEVTRVAPALLTRQATLRNEGAIIDILNGAHGPFRVKSPNSSYPDKLTRLILYGTGFRYANNPELDARAIDPAKRLSVTAIAANGRRWPVTIESAGAVPPTDGDEHPGIPSEFYNRSDGVDQLVVILPEELDGLGIVKFVLSAETIASNAVNTLIASTRPALIENISRGVVRPGAVFEIIGSGFAEEGPDAVLQRNRVTLNYGGNQAIETVPLFSSSSRMRIMMPPIVLEDKSWYQGPVGLCATVDGIKTCAEHVSLRVGQPIALTGAAGETLTRYLREISQQTENTLLKLRQQEVALALSEEIEKRIADLKGDIDAAAAGAPRTFSSILPDGKEHMFSFNLDVLREVEILLAAYLESTEAAESSEQKVTKGAKSADVGCMSPVEAELYEAKLEYDRLLVQKQVIEKVFENTFWISAGIGCGVGVVGGIAGCLTGVASVLETWAPVAIPLVLENFVLYDVPRLLIELGPNSFSSLQVLPASAVGRRDIPVEVLVQGLFGANTNYAAQTLLDLAIDQSIGKLVPAKIRGQLPKEAQKALLDLFGILVADNLKEAARPFVEALKRPGAPSRSVSLGKGSVTVNSDGPEAVLELTCGLGSNLATAKVDLTKDFRFEIAFDVNSFLHVDPESINVNATFDLLAPRDRVYYPLTYLTPAPVISLDLVSVTYDCPIFTNSKPGSLGGSVYGPGLIARFAAFYGGQTTFNLQNALTCKECDQGSGSWLWAGSITGTTTTQCPSPVCLSATRKFSAEANHGVLTETMTDDITGRYIGGADGARCPEWPYCYLYRAVHTTKSVYDIRNGVQYYTYTVATTNSYFSVLGCGGSTGPIGPATISTVQKYEGIHRYQVTPTVLTGSN